MGVFGYAVICGLLSLWFWWLERRRAATVRQLNAAATSVDEDDEDEDEDGDRDRERRRRLLRAARFPVHGCFVVFGIAAIVFFVLSFFRTVPSGSVAVPVTFGKAANEVGPGLHLEWPITKMKNISVRTQSYTMAARGDDPSVQVLGSDAAGASADSTLLFRVVRSKATDVYDNLGTGYATTVVRPTARRCVREAFANGPLVEEATTRSNDVERAIEDCIKETLEPAGINVQDFQLRQLTLSQQLTNALDAAVASQKAGAVDPLDPNYRQFLYIMQFLQQAAKSGSNIVVTPDGTGLNVQVAPGK
jgi:SPFH domain/Band 7 family protein